MGIVLVPNQVRLGLLAFRFDCNKSRRPSKCLCVRIVGTAEEKWDYQIDWKEPCWGPASLPDLSWVGACPIAMSRLGSEQWGGFVC